MRSPNLNFKFCYLINRFNLNLSSPESFLQLEAIANDKLVVLLSLIVIRLTVSCIVFDAIVLDSEISKKANKLIAQAKPDTNQIQMPLQELS